MLQTIVNKILNSILKQYVQGFNSQNMKIALWSGQVIIQNVKLRQQIMKKINLPFKLKYSKLGTLKMIIPWKSLTTSKIVIQVDGLQLIITEIPKQLWECKNNKIIEKRKQQLKNYSQSIIQAFLKKSQTTAKTDDEKGYFGAMISKIIDNVEVTIKNIHIRYEDEITKKYSFGITLEQLKIYTINKNGQKQFIDRSQKQLQNQPLRKKLLLSNLGIYWNEKSQFFTKPQPHDQMIATIAKKDKQNKMNYLILMSSQALLYQRDAGKQYIQPQINIFIEFKQIKIKVSNQQLQQLVSMGQRLQCYINQVKLQNRIKLTQNQMIQNHKQFLQLYPSFYEQTITDVNLKKIQNILQKMQIDNFTQGIKSYHQKKQKQKIVKQKQNKKQGQFSYSKPKQLTDDQMKQIQLFMTKNFGVQQIITKRPTDFFYIKVNFKLNVLGLTIANTNIQKKQQNGIFLRLQEISINFGLRQNGYLLEFMMDNISVDLYQHFLNINNTIHIVQKISQQNLSRTVKQYIKLKVVGNPLDKNQIDTQIILATQQLIIQFDPKIIKIAQDFANIKINQKNTQAAIQAYGQIKNKVSIAATDAATTITSTEKKKNFISLDVRLSSINTILYFDPFQKDKDIWAICLGQTKIFSDPQILKKPQFAEDEPEQKYCLNTSKVSFTHFQNKTLFFQSKLQLQQIKNKQSVLSDISLDIQIQLFKKSTQKIPKIRATTSLHNLNLNLSQTTYTSLQKISTCFIVPMRQQSQIIKQKQKQNQKSVVMKQAKKIQVIYQQTKQIKKYIAVLSGSYLYCYLDKKDNKYTTYYFVKNSTTTKIKQQDVSKKPFSLVVQNSFNKFTLGFDKQQALQQWQQAIKSINQQPDKIILDKQIKQQKKIILQKNPNLLNFQVCVRLQKISLNAIVSQNQKVSIQVISLNTNAKLYQAKIHVKIQLKQIKITDNFYHYKYRQLQNFLYSTALQGKQQLIDINFLMYQQTHPSYNYVDADINMQVGGLACNFKPQTVQNLMLFFLPKSSQTPISTQSTIQQQKKHEAQIKKLQQQSKKRKQQKILDQIKQNKKQKFNIKLNLQISQISIALVNSKSKTMFSKVGLNNFQLQFGQSSRRMSIKGGIQSLWLLDFSNYPKTIIAEQSQYKQFKYIVSSFTDKKTMVFFAVQLLQLPNQSGKTLLVKSNLSSMKVSYIQQPVLRLITYLTQQVLPSLLPQKKAQKQKQIWQLKTKPKASEMQIIIDIQNILAMIQPRDNQNQYLQLYIKSVTVRNNSYLRSFIRQSKNQDQKVLVQNYYIKVQGISIKQSFCQIQNKLTNDMNIDLSCDLIQNSPYYLTTYGSRYQPGMRIQCTLTPFLMRINHDDFNFIMKCLFWNISYDDNAQSYFFNTAIDQQQKIQQNKQKQPVSQPIYVQVSMQSIILCVTQNQIPLSVLFLGNLNLNLIMSDEMRMYFKMNNLKGSNITTVDNILIQQGMFNDFGFQRKLNKQDLIQIQPLTQFYSVSNFNQKSLDKNNQKPPVIDLQLILSKTGNIIIGLIIHDLKIAIHLRSLLILSKLAIMEKQIQPPKSQIVPLIIKKQQIIKKSNNLLINIKICKFLGCLSDQSGKNYVVIQGNFNLGLLMESQKTQDQIQLQLKTNQKIMAAKHQISLQDFSIYFCNVIDLTNKRYFLLPLNLTLKYQQCYNTYQKNIFLSTIIQIILQKIILQCSITDMMMINKIIQDNLKIYTQYQNQIKTNRFSKIQQTQKRQTTSELQNINQDFDHDIVKKTIQQVQKKIQNRMKASISLQPMQIKVINDCNNNLMPVLNFILQQTNIIFFQDLIQTRFTIVPTINLDFFNPLSASWQPVIQTFRINIDYSSSVTDFGPYLQIQLTSSQVQQYSQLKFNISTQLISSLLATLQISKKQKQKIQQVSTVNQIQVSPYIIQNLTNKQITISRLTSHLIIKSLQKRSVKLDDKAQQLQFQYQRKVFATGLDRYGSVQIPLLKDLHLQIKMNQLNRNICFVNHLVIKNQTQQQPLLCLRYNQHKKLIDNQIQMKFGDIVPIQMNWYVQFCLLKSNQPSKAGNKTSTPLLSISDLQHKDIIQGQNGKFRLNIAKKRQIMGHITFIVRAPIMLVNCLPKTIEIKFLKKGKEVSCKTIKALHSHQVYAPEDINNLSFQVSCEGFYWSQPFAAVNQWFGKQCELILKDRQTQHDNTTIKYIFQRDLTKQDRLNIFCPAFILSQLDYDVQIYSSFKTDDKKQKQQTTKYYKLGGQGKYWNNQTNQQQQRKLDKITIIGSKSGSKIRVCGHNCIIDFSQPISIQNIGVSQARAVIQKQLYGTTVHLFTTLGVQVQLRKMSQKTDIYSRQITLHSRQIFVNNTNYKFMVMQDGGDKRYCMTIQKGQKKPFFFTTPFHKQGTKKYLFKLDNTEPSIPLFVNVLGAIYFKLRVDNQTQQFLYFKLLIQQVQPYLFNQISQVNYQDLPYSLIVKASNIQAHMPVIQKQTKKNSPPILFINQAPQQGFNVPLYIRKIGNNAHQQVTVQADNLKYTKYIDINDTKGMKIPIKVYVIFSDKKRYIIVDDIRNQKQVQQFDKKKIHLTLQKLSFSIIQNQLSLQHPFESFYFYMSNLQFILLQTNKTTSYQTKLQFLQIDQSQPFHIMNPVILTPQLYKQFNTTDPKQKPKFIFNAFIQIDNSFVKNLFINKIFIYLNNFVINIGSPFIKLIMKIIKNYTDVIDASKSQQNKKYQITIDQNNWNKITLNTDQSKTFLQHIKISQFTVDINAQIRLNQLDRQNLVIFGTIMNALGVVVTSIDGASIKLDGIDVQNCVDSLQGLQQKLIKHYKSSAMKQLYKIFGSLNIIGNPTSLFKNISTGFTDLKNKPSQGFVQGPLQFGKGIAKGTTSVVTHTIGGALNSVQKVTGTIASGLAALTFDKQYEQMRQKQKMKKPKHVFQGIGKGGKAVFHGFKQGITGLILKPYQNTKNQGAIGFIKGTGQGLAGLIVKPVTGIIDFASKTTQGLKNTALYYQDKPNQNRIRYPRVLYTRAGIVRQYNEPDSKLNAILKKTKYQDKQQLKNQIFIQSFKIGSKQFVVILKQSLVFIDIQKQKIQYISYLSNLQVQRVQQNILKIKTKNRSFNKQVKFESQQDTYKFQKIFTDLKMIN